jgi:toxin YhaV
MQANGWEIFAHDLLLQQLERLTNAVEKARAKNPRTYLNSANGKLLAALRELMFVTIPRGPSDAKFRQGGTLGTNHKHWFRAKFGGQRFRLFFRFDSTSKVIIYAWVNDADTLRTYGSKSDAYAVFRKLLEKGDPPSEWAQLLRAAKRVG